VDSLAGVPAPARAVSSKAAERNELREEPANAGRRVGFQPNPIDVTGFTPVTAPTFAKVALPLTPA